MKIFKLISALTLITLINSCTKDIIIKTEPYASQLSIECILYPNKVPQLFLSTSVPYFSTNVTPQQLFARGATVIITGTSTDNLVSDSTFDNFRCRWVSYYKGSIPAQIGQTYTLTVTYAGKTYSASTTINQPQTQIQSTSYVQVFHDIWRA